MRHSKQGGESMQCRALLAYLSLTARAATWAKQMVMLTAADEAAPFALATLAAGGAVLWTCADEAELRESGHAGTTDFQVTTLSEALRILKNEIRQGLPVSVGVLDAAHTVWNEAVTRGVQPEALLAGAWDAAPAEVLLLRGAARLGMQGGPEVAEQAAATWRERRTGDEGLLAAAGRLPEPDRGIATRWLWAAPRLFPRDTTRCYAAAWDASKGER